MKEDVYFLVQLEVGDDEPGRCVCCGCRIEDYQPRYVRCHDCAYYGNAEDPLDVVLFG